jgi:hypothetical protein
MRWTFLKRLARPKREVIASIDDVHVSAAGANRDDPAAIAAAHRLEEDLRRELEGVHDPDEVRARVERYEREHGMKTISSSSARFELVPDRETIKREGPDGLRRMLQELDRQLEGADDPAERRLRMESFARERGWTIRES